MAENAPAVAEAVEQPTTQSKKPIKPTETKKRGSGQPTKLTEATVNLMCEQFELGMSARYVCQYVMVAEPTFYLWVRLAEADIDAGIKPDWKRGRYVKFLQCVYKAQAAFMSHNLSKLHKEPDQRAPMFLLERKAPEEWGKKDRQSEEVTKPRQGVVVETGEVDAIAEILDAAKAKGGDWLLLALETLSGKALGADIPTEMLALPDHPQPSVDRSTKVVEDSDTHSTIESE